MLIDEEGAILARGSRSLAVTYPQPAWVEQDPLEIWQSVRDAVDECLAAAGGAALAAVAVTNQRESVMIWERKTGRPLGPVAVWQCRRGAPFCAELRDRGLEPWLRARTGLTIDSMFSASKVRWLLQHVPDGMARVGQGEICAGTMDSWVLWNLTRRRRSRLRRHQCLAHAVAGLTPVGLEPRPARPVRRAGRGPARAPYLPLQSMALPCRAAGCPVGFPLPP